MFEIIQKQISNDFYKTKFSNDNVRLVHWFFENITFMSKDDFEDAISGYDWDDGVLELSENFYIDDPFDCDSFYVPDKYEEYILIGRFTEPDITKDAQKRKFAINKTINQAINSYKDGMGIIPRLLFITTARLDSKLKTLISEAAKTSVDFIDLNDLERLYEFAKQSYRGDGVDFLEELLPLATSGDKNSQYKLAVAYYTGPGHKDSCGLKRDFYKATYWFNKAAEQGLVGAQYYFGLMYFKGQGLVQAYAWSNLAATNGFSKAVKLRDEVAKELTKSHILKAQQLAIEIEQKISKHIN